MPGIMESLNVTVTVTLVLTLVAPPVGAMETTDVLAVGAIESLHDASAKAPMTRAAAASSEREGSRKSIGVSG
jgi:hypothetical protein